MVNDCLESFIFSLDKSINQQGMSRWDHIEPMVVRWEVSV
jgi:hypothetical protein